MLLLNWYLAWDPISLRSLSLTLKKEKKNATLEPKVNI